MALPRASDSEREVGPLPRASSGAAQAAAARPPWQARDGERGAAAAGRVWMRAAAARPPQQ